jgi:sec-independent protein translocase protein TatC
VRAIDDTPKRRKDDPKEMSFLDHLDELRTVLIQSAAAFAILMVISWFFSGRILDLLVRPLPVESLYFQSPTEAFVVRVRISLAAGLMAAFPFILFRVWAFVSPALFSHERKRILPFALASSTLFYAGVAFCYLVLIPIVLEFLLAYGTPYLNPLISVNSYFAFVARLCFAFGVVFQLPVVVLLLSILGIVTPQWLLRQWRYGVLVVFVGSAVLTPPDAVSMVAMALPVILLYLASVLVAFVVLRRKGKESGSVES